MSMIDEDSHSEEEKEYSPQKRQSKDCDGLADSDTLMELAEMEENYDDEEYVDSDWEPSTENSNENEEDSDGSSALWFCTNCTMKNSDDLSHCKSCKEYKNSGILKHGCFASQFQQGFANSSDLDVTMECTEHRNYSTVIGFDDRMLLHYEIGKSHPHVERPDRILAISASLSFAGIFPGKCFLIPPREISEEELNLVHAKDNIEAVKSTKHFLHSYFTPDTYTNKYSACAARLAAGFCSDLAISIMTGKARNGFSLVRPPGHHAGIKKAMGFCLHNNAAIAAIAAQSVGAKKILIVDWDVHHGNGTQEIFEENKSVLYISLHRHDDGIFYPGTGAADEVGILEGKGYSVNVPWKTGGVGDNDYIFAFQNIILPIASKFAPDFTIVSAGFDAARGDPLGCCDVTPAGYAQMTHMLCDLSQGKMLVILEGGYNLRSISSSAVAVVKVLLGEIPRKKPSDDINPTFKGYQTVMEVLKIQSRFWPFLTAKYDQIQLKWASAIYQKRNGSHGKQKKRSHTDKQAEFQGESSCAVDGLDISSGNIPTKDLKARDFDAFLNSEMIQGDRFQGDRLIVTEHMQAPRIAGMYKHALEKLDPWIVKEDDWKHLEKMDVNNLDDACYIRSLQAVGIERFKQKRGVRRTQELNASMEEVTRLTGQLSLKETDLENARRQVETLTKEKDDALTKVEAIEKDVESAKVVFADRVKVVSERNKRVCFKNFVDGMCHERDMVNLQDPQFESVVVPMNRDQWKQWQVIGIPGDHPAWPETLDELNDSS